MGLKKIVTIGSATQDIFILCDPTESLQLNGKQYAIFEEGKKLEITHLQHSLGGGALNTAATLHKLGLNAYPICKIGIDTAGTFIGNALQKAGINTQYIIKDPQLQTGTSFILPAAGGDRTILAYRGANGELEEQDIPYNALSDAEYVYISPLSKKSSHLFSTICTYAKKHGSFIVANPGLHQVTAHETLNALAHIDLFALNMFEATTFMNTLNQTGRIKDFFKTIHAHGPRIIIITDGVHGVYVSTIEKEYFSPSIPTLVATTVGVGDAFIACFVGMLAHGHDIPTALNAGLINSASVLQHIDAQQGILDYAQIMNQIQQLYPEFLP